MPRPVYSTQFLEMPVQLSGVMGSYTVPAGFVAVIRDVSLVVLGGSVGDELLVYTSANAFLAGTTLATAPTVFDYHFTGNVVVTPGETVSCAYSGTSYASGIISGYLLTTP